MDRIYPGKCKPAVRVGDAVGQADIISHCEVSGGQRLVKVAHVLGVSTKEVGRHLTRKMGERIYQGEILAKKRSLFGSNQVKSPVDGVITDIDSRGDVILKFLPKPVRLFAGAGGKVQEITDEKITISTVATRIRGVAGSGKEREGIIAAASSPKDFILPASIGPDAQGKILVGGALLEKGALEKAVTIGVRGLVVGGMNFRDFSNLGVATDVGITVIVTEGFGALPMSQKVWSYFQKKQGLIAFISGEKTQVLIPETNEEGVSAASEQLFKELVVGDKVSYFREEEGHRVGVVRELPGEQLLNSGIFAEVAKVAFDSGEEMFLPTANLDIIG